MIRNGPPVTTVAWKGDRVVAGAVAPPVRLGDRSGGQELHFLGCLVLQGPQTMGKEYENYSQMGKSHFCLLHDPAGWAPEAPTHRRRASSEAQPLPLSSYLIRQMHTSVWI